MLRLDLFIRHKVLIPLNNNITGWEHLKLCTQIQLMANKVNWSRKKITSFLTNPLISGYLLKATAFMVTPKIIINALAFCFLIKYKTLYIIMKIEQIEQTRIVYAQWDRWTSYDG